MPRGYGAGLMTAHDVRPFAASPAEIAEMAAEVKDRNYRIQVAKDGVHLYNRDIHVVETDAFEFFPHIDVGADIGHAFYLGAELQKAEIAFSLGKRYAQDNPLDFGVAAPPREADRTRLEKAGHTLKAKTGKARDDKVAVRSEGEEAADADEREASCPISARRC